MSLLLILPPLTQVNTPYPSLSHLSAYTESCGVSTIQSDLGIDLISELFTKQTLAKVFDIAEQSGKLTKTLRITVSNRAFYERNVDTVKSFLRGECPEMATLFARRQYWQDMHRLPDEDDLEWAYGLSGTTDRAKYLCSLFLKNITDVIHDTIDDRFELIRYGEKICTYLTDFDILQQELDKPDTLITQMLEEMMANNMEIFSPDIVGLSVPFPGNMIGALLCAKYIRKNYPDVKIVMGGGYVNTELRQMTDTGLFDYIDYLTFDDGELPLMRIIKGGALLRTAHSVDGKVVYENMDSNENVDFASLPAPDIRAYDLEFYFDFVDSTNPMHRLWSDGRWLKMMLAHGCYWSKCTFCDTSLDYIGRFQMAKASVIVDRMEKLMNSTEYRGFHFVDEAAPPALLRALAEEILKRGLVLTYWTNIRFDSSFTPELAYLLAQSGCIAVSGGLEVASPRVLKLINKGVTVESATECMRNLSEQGIMVHTYLMYGFPTQTVDELYDSLITVRNLFAKGYVKSAFWHQYAMTCHSPSGRNPQSVGATHLDTMPNAFANNEIPFSTDPAIDWSRYSDGLNLATYNYMQGSGFDLPAKYWFKGVK